MSRTLKIQINKRRQMKRGEKFTPFNSFIKGSTITLSIPLQIPNGIDRCHSFERTSQLTCVTCAGVFVSFCLSFSTKYFYYLYRLVLIVFVAFIFHDHWLFIVSPVSIYIYYIYYIYYILIRFYVNNFCVLRCHKIIVSASIHPSIITSS